MILDKAPLPGDEVEIQDAPPSYDALDDLPQTRPQDEKAAGPSTSRLPDTPTSLGSRPTPTSASASGSLSSSWFPFSPTARAAREVRITVLGLIRDLVKQEDTQGAQGILESCVDACKRYELSLSSILQEKSAEGHTLLYWAIANHPDLPPRPEDPDLVSALLAHAAPLTDATVEDIGLACMNKSSHALFQKLRRTPAFAPLSGSEELITRGSTPVDDIEVEDVKDDEGAFVVKLKIPMFNRRMRFSQSIKLEFIAKARLWELSFLVVQRRERRLNGHDRREGSWVVKLALLPHSPPTWIDSRLVIEDPRTRTHSEQFSQSTSSWSSGPKLKPRIDLRLKSSEQLMAPRSSSSRDATIIVVSLEEHTLANKLQFSDCPYFDSEGTLVARLEARLARTAFPSSEDCVVC
ncbi:hypothetical protein C8Q80DRAFT_1148403 [Daedaleopsis nitida]|nr:hypothetical protein C8Q80DRAFT_1148403 [Daedaleopsis nitida]